MNPWHCLVAIFLKGCGINGESQIFLKNILILRMSDYQWEKMMKTIMTETVEIKLPMIEEVHKPLVGDRGLPIVGSPLTVNLTFQINHAMNKHLGIAISCSRKRYST